jgi:cell division protein FtsN
VKNTRHKSFYRRGDSDRYSSAFFILGALIVIAIAFFFGFQVGRIVEKDAVTARNASKVAGQKKADIRKEMSAYSEEAVRIPVVAPPPAVPPTAGEDLRETEAAATFPDSLTRKDAAPQPLVKAKQNGPAETQGKSKFMLQAAALKNKEAAESLRSRLEKAGHRAKVVRLQAKDRGPDLYKVRIGPHGSREEAMKAMKSIKAEFKIDVILLKD